MFAEGRLWQVAAKLNTLLTSENERLQQLTEGLKQKHSHMPSEVGILTGTKDLETFRFSKLLSSFVWRQVSLSSFLVQSRSLGRAANKAEQRISELQVLIEELQWDMEKIRRRENRLNAHLSEILERVRMSCVSRSNVIKCYLKKKKKSCCNVVTFLSSR